MEQPKITISMPCFGRPERTRRAVCCIFEQNINGWEAFIMGDGCDHFNAIIAEDWFAIETVKARANGNIINTKSWMHNFGGCGYEQTNYAIRKATGKYFVFLGNDDIIKNYHFKYYLSQIENTDLDFVYFDTELMGKHVKTNIKRYAGIGHNSLIIRTAFLQQMPLHKKDYGHDYTLIQNMLAAGARYGKSISTLTSYHATNDSHNRNFENID